VLMNWITLTGIILLFAGILIILLAIGLLKGLGGSGKARIGGVVLLGPIPIVFGDRSLASVLLIVAMVFVILFIILALIW
jgi:uncharacterized membrane protein